MIYSSGPRPWRRYRFDTAQVELGNLPIFGGTWKTTLGLATASTKTVVGLALTYVKTFIGLTP